jgi:hypothetical protein
MILTLKRILMKPIQFDPCRFVASKNLEGDRRLQKDCEALAEILGNVLRAF